MTLVPVSSALFWRKDEIAPLCVNLKNSQSIPAQMDHAECLKLIEEINRHAEEEGDLWIYRLPTKREWMTAAGCARQMVLPGPLTVTTHHCSPTRGCTWSGAIIVRSTG